VSAIDECTICYDGSIIEQDFRSVDLANGYTCSNFEIAAGIIDETDERCQSYYHLIGMVKCGCPIPNDDPTGDELCNLCIDGSMPNEDAVFDETRLGSYEAGVFTCGDAYHYLSHFEVDDNVCLRYQEQGVARCGCADLLPSDFPSSSPTDFPSSSPTRVDEKAPDCEALKQGQFPEMTDGEFVASTEFGYYMNLFLGDGFTVEGIAIPLQDALDRIMSVAAVGCDGTTRSRRRLEVERTLGDVIIHYVEFSGLEAGEGSK